MKLTLGTAQFGFDYGVSNNSGRVSHDVASELLKIAKTNDFNSLDTAIDYGECEELLGSLGVSTWNVVTKLPALPEKCDDPFSWVANQTKLSIKRLGVSKLYGLLLHRPIQLQEDVGPTLYQAMQEVKAQGLVSKVGVSIYSPKELGSIFDNFSFDIVQAPLNILDRNLIESGWANQLSSNGVEVHARSVFLQGLLLMSNENRPDRFNRWPDVWAEWSRWLSATRLTPLQGCIQYVRMFKDIDNIVVGANSVNQLIEIISNFEGELSSLPKFSPLIDERLINPASWNVL